MYPLLSLGSGRTRKKNKSVHWTLPCHPYAKKSASQADLSMQVTLHATRRTPYGASRLVQAMSFCSATTRRAPSRHYRDARVYGHTTTAMHDMSTTPSKNFQRSIDQKPATHKDGWFATATRIFQRAEDIVAVMCQVCNSPKTL